MDRVTAARKVTKKVPTQSLDLSFSSRKQSNNNTVTATAVPATAAPGQSSFAPTLNKKSIQIAQSKREGRIEDHLIKQGELKGELQKKKKAEME